MSKKSRRVAKARRALLTLSLVLVMMMVAVGGTIAWLTDTSDTLTNVFETSDIGVTLAETERTYQMIPGHTIDKDPKVTLAAGSVDSYLFVVLEEVDASYNYTNEAGETISATYAFETLLDYDVDTTKWTELTAGSNIWYCTATAGQTVEVLVDNKVTVLDTVTKEMMNNINSTGATKPQLVITAYACQQMKDNTTAFNAADAWAAINPTTGE